MTPLILMLLVEFYTTPEAAIELASIAHEEAFEWLEEQGLIASNKITQKGKSHVIQLLSLPLPKQVWVDCGGCIIEH